LVGLLLIHVIVRHGDDKRSVADDPLHWFVCKFFFILLFIIH